MPYNLQAARQAGANDDQILSYLAGRQRFDVTGATKAGASKQQILDYLAQNDRTDTPYVAGPGRGGNRPPAPGIQTVRPVPDGMMNQFSEGVDQLTNLGGNRSGQKFKGVHNIVEGGGKMAATALLPEAAVAAPVATAAGLIGGAAGTAVGKYGSQALGAPEDVSNLVGDIGGVVGGTVAGGGAKLFSRREPHDPGNLMNIALSPPKGQSEFLNTIDTSLGHMKRGIQDNANLPGGIDPKSIPPKEVLPVASEGLQTAMDDHMSALNDYIENSSRKEDKMPVAAIKQAEKAAIPQTTRDEFPAETQALDAAIDAKFPNKDALSTREVFDFLHRRNALVSSFENSPEIAQNTKIMAGGDTASLRAGANAARQWIYENPNLGPDASRLNEEWGNMKALKGLIDAKRLPAARQEATTPLEGDLQAIGIDPGGLATPKYSIINSLLSKMAGRPEGINALVKAAIDNTDALPPPARPTKVPIGIAAPPDASGMIGYNPASVVDSEYAPQTKLLPAATSQIGVSGVIAPDLAGEIMQGQKRIMSGPKQLPAATSGIGVSGVIQPEIAPKPPLRGSGAQNLLPPPTPGQPPVNILPSGTTSSTTEPLSGELLPTPTPRPTTIGPASPVTVQSAETPIPLPKAGNIVQRMGRAIAQSQPPQ